MALERLRGEIYDGNVGASLKSSVEAYLEMIREGFKSKEAMDKVNTAIVVAGSPLVFPLFVAAAGFGAGINRVGDRIASKKSTNKPKG